MCEKIVVFGTVVYSGALCYFEEFINSINSQTDKDFDVIIINDNIENDVISEYIKKIKIKSVCVIDETASNQTPVQLRIELLKEAKKRGYSLLISGDCDDLFHKDRVKYVKKAYLTNNKYAFYYNELVLPNGEIVLKNIPFFINSEDDVLESNFLGLSNNSINLEKLSFEWIDSLNDCTSFVFDWYLFTRILLLGEKGCLVKEAKTIYRIHENNSAGLNNQSNEMLEKEIEVKKKHYKMLSKYSDKFLNLYNVYKNLGEKTVFLNNENSSFWWSNIKTKENTYEL